MILLSDLLVREYQYSLHNRRMMRLKMTGNSRDRPKIRFSQAFTDPVSGDAILRGFDQLVLRVHASSGTLFAHSSTRSRILLIMIG